jgi:hypothetical protein
MEPNLPDPNAPKTELPKAEPKVGLTEVPFETTPPGDAPVGNETLPPFETGPAVAEGPSAPAEPVNLEGLVDIDDINNFDYTPVNQRPVSFRLPKYFILVFAAVFLLMAAGGAVYGYSLKETVEKQKEKVKLATQSEAIQAEIRKATADTETLNKAGEVKNIWLPLIERRPSVAKFMEKVLIVTPNDVKLESLKYDLSKVNLARTDVTLVLGVVEQTEDGAGYKLQKMRTDLVRYTQYRPDSLNTRYLGTAPISFQGSEAKLIRAEVLWAFTLDKLGENDLTAVYERLNKTNPIK